MRRGRKIFLIALVTGAIFVFTNKFFVEAKVLISEVMVENTTSADEYVELYNYSSSSVDISGLSLKRITAGGTLDNLVYKFKSNSFIGPFGYFLVAHPNYSAINGVVDYYSYSNKSCESCLVGKDNGVVLFSDTSAEDVVIWGSIPSSTYNCGVFEHEIITGTSIIRKPNTEEGDYIDTDDCAADFITDAIPDPQNSSSTPRPNIIVEPAITTPTTTPGIPTTTPEIETPTTTPITSTTTPEISTTTTSTVPMINTSSIWSQLKINEFVSNPELGNEWVELFNPATSSMDLTGGYLCDERGATSSYACKDISGEIGALGWLYFDLLTTSYLNNDGDALYLKNVEGEVIDEIFYDKNAGADKGESYARIVNGADTDSVADWSLTTSITPGAQNIITVPVVSSGGGSSGKSSTKTTTKTETTTATTTATATTSKNYSGIILNEIFPDPAGADTDNEFIEIYNTTSAAVDLTGWKISDSAKAFVLSGSIAAESYLYFLRSETNIALNNSTSEEVKLLTPDDEPADYISYDRAEENMAFARTVSGTWAWTTSSTPGAQNYFYVAPIVVYDTSAPAAEKIIFSEICPNPKGADEREFVEIFNDDERPVNVGNWTIANLKKQFVIPEETMIYPGSYLVFYKAESGLTLNNTEEELTLANSFGQSADSVQIAAAKEGVSYSLAGGAWQWTEELTPAKENKIVITPTAEKSSTTKNKTTYRAMSIALAREAESDTGVIVRGVVSSLPGNFGVQYFYIFDGKDGVQIYNSKKNFLKFKIGDKVEITGTIGEAGGVKRIKTKNKEAADILSVDNTSTPIVKSLDEIGEDDAGRLVSVEGDITEIKSNYMYLDNQLGEVKIYFKKGASINKSAHAEGERVRVTGIVEMGNDGVQIWPRDNFDIVSVSGTQKVAGEKIESTEEKSSSKNILLFGGLFAAVILGLILKNYGASLIIWLKKIFRR